jgi:hypothetical protein
MLFLPSIPNFPSPFQDILGTTYEQSEQLSTYKPRLSRLRITHI